MFVIAGLNRFMLLDFLEKECNCCEIGVFKGVFSENILQRVSPKQLVLVDSWEINEKDFNPFPDIPEHFQSFYQVLKHFGGENYDDSTGSIRLDFSQIYEDVKTKFVECDNVQIVNKNSHEAADIFPNESFDYAYIDASHQYEWVLRDLLEWSKKVKRGGIIGINDCANSPQGRKQNLGVLEAVCHFIKRSNWKPITLTLNDFSELYITNDLRSSFVKHFTTNLLSKAPFVLEVDDSLLSSYSHKIHLAANERKLIPSFKL